MCDCHNNHSNVTRYDKCYRLIIHITVTVTTSCDMLGR